MDKQYLCAMVYEDKELILQIRNNDSERAFRALFDRHYERMYRAALYFVQNEDLAKEVSLDVLAGIWEKRKSMIIPDDFRHYSFVMVRNAAINIIKKESALEGNVPITNASSVDAGFSISPEELLEQSELFETYERLVSELPERCREVYMMVKEDGRSYADVAQELNISVKTVDAQLQKALSFLRQNLSHYLDCSSGRRFFAIFL